MSDDRHLDLHLERVAWSVDGRAILDGVTLTAPSGGVTGVLGPNGSGKSSLLRALVGALRVDDGAFLLAGEDLRAMSRRTRAQRLALVEQEAPTDVALTALDVVLLGRTPHRSRWSADSGEDEALARAALERCGAAHLAGRDLARLSGGERQRVHLARALAQEPQVLLLDEPTNHLDVAAQLALLRLVAGLEVTSVLVLHDLNQALRWCDHVVVLADGRVVAAGEPEEVLTPATIARVYGVAAEVVRTADGRPVLVLSGLADA
ncbi:ABC transporter ATP-binding protein [Litorihabitans aurantiacus]|uniref:ABC transporter ATP-binding protein n=1 Tax=Litorihabitans aurantiacus TaxID=1930061 RepID=UPI0024E0E046|nr:ABC transporter ATP-binding protein [Litorihabitans aurantiacus]